MVASSIVGAWVEAALDVSVTKDIFVGPWASFTITGAPLNEDTWFNRPLGGTRYFRAGMSLRVEL